eukprot:COSAG02_NODE_18_length_54986_cov_345.599322_45_plen_238_part_00
MSALSCQELLLELLLMSAVLWGTTSLVGAQVVAPPAADAACDQTKVPQLLTDISTACTGYANGQQCSLACELAMAPAMLGDCKNSVTAIVGDGLAQTLAREWQACVGANAPADVAAAVSAAANCGDGVAPPVPAGSGHRRAQDAIDAVLAAFVAGDGSVCAMATALGTLPLPPAPPPCEDDPAWTDVMVGRGPCSSFATDREYYCSWGADAAGVTAAVACPVSCQSGCALTYDDCCA